LLTSSARAQTRPVVAAVEHDAQSRFGDAGEWVMLGTSNGAYFFKETFSNSDAKYVEVDAAIGIDRFIARHVSIGLDLGGSYFNDQSYGVDTLRATRSNSVGAGARFGYDVPLGQLFSWYPRLTLGLSRTYSKTTVSLARDSSWLDSSVASRIGPVVNLYAPLLLHLAPHLFVGFGPRLQHHFGVQRGGPSDGTQSTLISGDFVLGGWWGERGVPAASSAHTVETDDASFGQRGQLVLSLATDASVSHRSDSASKASRTDADLVPSADYFVLDHLSIGVNAFISHSSGNARDFDGTRVDFASTRLGIGPRLGSSVRIVQWCTFWPQLELGYGTVSTEFTSSRGTNQHSRKRSWLRLSAPFLFSVTSHFLLGAGPYFFHEISDTDQYDKHNEAESVGVRLLMAGWF